jgi:Cu/Zn superoxide dismutase
MLSLILLAGLSAAFTPEVDYRISTVTINQSNQIGGQAIGQIRVVEAKPGGSLFLEVSLSGMVPNAAFNLNIHYGTVGANFDCSAPTGHFNPTGKNHGLPADTEGFHLGDFGRNLADDDGIAEYGTLSGGASFFGPNAITTGLSFIISEGMTDRGRGGDAGSRANGNSGPRISCGDITEIIEVIVAPVSSTASPSDVPTVAPTASLTAAPTVTLTDAPTVTPTVAPNNAAPTDPTASSASSIAAFFFVVVAFLV